MRHLTLAAALAAVCWSLPAASQAPGGKKTIQCWTDQSGQRMCGDRVPPEYAGQKRELMEGGRVVGTVKGAKTPEEIAEEERQKKAAADAAARADYDRALLETYRSARDIEAMRDERLLMIDSRIKSIEKNSADTDKSLEGMQARADALAKENKPVDERLAKQIKEFKRAQKTHQKALERNRAERDAVKTRFDSDLARYQELRGRTAAPVSLAPASGTGAPLATPTAPAAAGGSGDCWNPQYKMYSCTNAKGEPYMSATPCTCKSKADIERDSRKDQAHWAAAESRRTAQGKYPDLYKDLEVRLQAQGRSIEDCYVQDFSSEQFAGTTKAGDTKIRKTTSLSCTPVR